MQVPRLEKIVVNMCRGSGAGQQKADAAAGDLTAITGQRPVITKASDRSPPQAGQGMPIGCK